MVPCALFPCSHGSKTTTRRESANTSLIRRPTVVNNQYKRTKLFSAKRLGVRLAWLACASISTRTALISKCAASLACHARSKNIMLNETLKRSAKVSQFTFIDRPLKLWEETSLDRAPTLLLRYSGCHESAACYNRAKRPRVEEKIRPRLISEWRHPRSRCALRTATQ